MNTASDSFQQSRLNRFYERFGPVLLIGFLLIVGLLSYDYQRVLLNVLFLEGIHALVVVAIFTACLVYQRRYPHIRQFGWHYIVWGIGLLMFGTLVDIVDNPPGYGDYYGLRLRFPIGATWETAFFKKMIGYAAGISLFAYGFFQWIPWMIRTRLDVQKLNDRLSLTNRNLNRALMSLDEHVESERVSISRELHDDVAQQLTFVNVQVQLCRRELETGQTAEVSARLDAIADNVSGALKSVRQISSGLRPEALFSLGLAPALEQFVEKIRQQNPQLAITLLCPESRQAPKLQIERQATDQQLLHLFRIIQEGIRNAVRHSGGSIRIQLSEQDNALTIRVLDSGQGLPWKTMPPDDELIRQGHLGLVGMKERVRELNGMFALSNRTDGPGTCLEVTLSL